MIHQHFRFYKPVKVISQFVRIQKRKKRLLGEFYDFPEGTMAIGRLDEDSEGLLLLTTDGKVSEKMRQKSIEKEYYAQVDGLITQEAIESLKDGVEIGVKGEKYLTLPCQARILKDLPEIPERGRKIRDERHGPTSWVSITVTEGKNRQVRKMTAAVGFPTLRLVRVRIDNIGIEGLDVGQVEEIEL